MIIKTLIAAAALSASFGMGEVSRTISTEFTQMVAASAAEGPAAQTHAE